MSVDAPSVLTVDRAVKRWPGGGGLASTSLALHRGELVVVRGRSGSGKSTLLSLLAGWCAPDSGTVTWAPAIDPASWTSLAVVPQAFGLFNELTIADNIEFPLRFRPAVASAERRAIVERLIAALGLGGLADRLPDEVSMGQQQRTAIARALAPGPAIVLIDEPTSHQDPRHAAETVQVLHEAVAQGTAMLVASHDPIVVAAATLSLDLDGEH